MPKDAPSTDPLLQPFQLRHLTIKNRIMSTSHACGLEEGGAALERYQRYHEEKAIGGLGLTMFGGSSNVSTDSPNTFQQLSVANDDCIPWMQAFSERIHRHGTKLMIQITHLGRRGENYTDNWLPMIAPSPIRETLHRSFPREMDEHDIARVIGDFADAARRCKDGGLDGLETLAGAHLIGQFLSPATNKRTDAYGGSLENRCRFGLEVYDAIRKAVGDEFVVGFRFVVDEAMAGGLSFEDCVEIAKLFERSGTIDFFNAVYGRMDTAMTLATDNMPGMASPIAPWLQKAGAFRREVNLPVFHAARISDIATARHAIAEGLLDMVAMTRAHIADPHIVAKLSRGEEDRIRPCVGATNCMSSNRPVCLHNANTGREMKMAHEIAPADVSQRAVVIGGGPAGLEAARVLAERGHAVTLLEASSVLGGQVQLARLASWRRDIIGIVDWRAAELERLGVTVRLNCLADADTVLALQPQIVIDATGGVPDIDWITGADLATSAWDALGRDAPADGSALIYDGTGRHTGASVAEHFAQSGRPTELVMLDETIAPELTYAERVMWKKVLYEQNVTLTPDHRLQSIEQAGNRLRAHFSNEVTGAVIVREADHVIIEHGTTPTGEPFDDLRQTAANAGVTDHDRLLAGEPQPDKTADDDAFSLYRIGDALASRNVAAAVYDALRLCRTL